MGTESFNKAFVVDKKTMDSLVFSQKKPTRVVINPCDYQAENIKGLALIRQNKTPKK